MKKEDEIFYEQMGPILIRTPLFPFELATQPALSSFFQAKFEAALAVGSPSFFSAFIKQNSTTELKMKILKYLRRMTTRPTPYGLFAGVDVGVWSDKTNIVRDDVIETVARVDMSCLGYIIQQLENDSVVRKQLSYLANPETIIEASRIWLNATTTGWPKVTHARATPPVIDILRLCQRTPLEFEVLTQYTSAKYSVSNEISQKLCDSLIDSGFLISNLRFPLDVRNPLDYLIGCLENKPAASLMVGVLRDLRDSLKLSESGQTLTGLQYLELMAQVPAPQFTHDLLQVDTRTRLRDAQLNRVVADDLTRLVTVLLRQSTVQNTDLKNYLNAFELRYQPYRLVPLLSMLSDVFGIGSPYKNSSAEIVDRSRRDEFLFDLALHNEGDALTLSKDDIDRIALLGLNQTTAPLSVDLFFQIIAQSQSDIDQGRFKILVAPRVGDLGAGRAAGRFARLVDGKTDDFLAKLFDAESEALNGGVVVDANYWTAEARVINIALSPHQGKYNVASRCVYSTTSQCIPFSEILIGTNSSEFFALWSKTGQRLVIRSRNLLNHTLLPDPVRFLTDILWQNKISLSAFSWGRLAEKLPYLPRVIFDKFILAPARWSLQELCRDESDFKSTFQALRGKYRIPNLVWIAESFDDDNQLFLDLSNDTDIELLKLSFAEARRNKTRLILYEYLNPQQWHEVNNQHYVTEFVASFICRQISDTQSLTVQSNQTAMMPREDYKQAPGGEWIYLRLECASILHEEVILELRNLLKEKLLNSLVRKWFYVRYSDTVDHLRLRFLIHPRNQLYKSALPVLCKWASSIVQSARSFKFSIDTYDREVERYGGALGIDLVESIFHVDSQVVSAYLSQSDNLDTVVVAVILVKALLTSFDLDNLVGKDLLFEELTAANFRAAANDCRKRSNIVTSVFSKSSMTDSVYLSEYHSVMKLGHKLKITLLPLAAELYKRERNGQLSRPVTQICQSLIHMHCNRLFGINHYAEDLTRILLGKFLMFKSKTPGA